MKFNQYDTLIQAKRQLKSKGFKNQLESFLFKETLIIFLKKLSFCHISFKTLFWNPGLNWRTILFIKIHRLRIKNHCDMNLTQ